MEDNTVGTPVWGHLLEDYINIGSTESPNWQNVSNLLSWEFDDDAETYEPEYIDTKKRPVFTLAKSATIEYEKDLYENNELDSFLVEHEDDTNIAVQVVRVYTWLGSDGARTSKMANFLLTPSALDKNSAGEPIKLTGTLTMNDSEWTKGFWDGSSFSEGVNTSSGNTDGSGTNSGSGDSTDNTTAAG